MSPARELAIAGIGAWTHGAPDWSSLRDVLRGERRLADDTQARPAANILAAVERRRAPDNVRLAVEVASQACAMAGMDPAGVACVFASTFGELSITDEVCATLARAPLELSPTRFHNSVLNAAAGYWTIATTCTAASSAVTAHACSFTAGLLEATTLACADEAPVLLVSSDVASAGPLAEMTRTHCAFGMAMVLTPAGSGQPRMRWTLGQRVAEPPAPAIGALASIARENPASRHALALLATLATAKSAAVALPLSCGLSLVLEVDP